MARLLVANGAPADMTGALRHYNDSRGYVTAVRAYARHMRRDPRSYGGYYGWQVVYAYDHRTVILPVGFPVARPTPLVGTDLSQKPVSRIPDDLKQLCNG